jgi:parallel beta-helix repeat protein
MKHKDVLLMNRIQGRKVMKTKKIFSVLMAAALAVFGIPQYAGSAQAATNNYQRAVAEYQTVYNVADYGVNTSSDCGAPITAMIKQIAKTRTDETTPIVIYMPSGNYNLSSPIKLNTLKNIHLVAEADTVVTASGKSFRDMVEIQETSNISVLGGKWDGNNKTKYDFKLYKASNITLSELEVTKAYERGIHAAATQVTINDVKTYSNKLYGLSSSQKSEIYLTNSSIYKNGKHGGAILDTVLHMENGNNRVYNNANSGISLSGSKAKLYASGNSFTGNGTAKESTGHGIGVAQGAYAEISNNTIDKNKQCGISLISKAKAVVNNNTLNNNGRHGIGAAESCTLTADGNTAKGNKWHGFMLRDKCKATLTNNVLSSNKVAGLSLEKTSGYIVLTGNTIQSNKSNGIIVTNGKVKLTKNTITKNKAFGIYTDGATVKLISDNVIKSNKKGDIDASGAKLSMGKNNTVKEVTR